MEKRFCLPCMMLTLALVGFGVAFYDSYQIYNGQPLWCPPPIGGCNEVASSPYARIYNLPLGYFGTVYYFYMFGVAALLAFDPYSHALRTAARSLPHALDVDQGAANRERLPWKMGAIERPSPYGGCTFRPVIGMAIS